MLPWLHGQKPPPPTVNGGSAELFKTGHGKSDVRLFTISVKCEKWGRTLTVTVRIVMNTYPMEIPLFPLQPTKIGLILSDDKGDGIRGKFSLGDRYGTAALIQGIKGEETQPPPLYDPLLGWIEAVVNDDPENLIVDCMEETYDFILARQIRELIRFWDRADDASRAALISGTNVAVTVRILLK